MDTIEHISPQFTLFAMLYGGAAVVAFVLCLYLLLRRGNAIAADTTPPMRLRRWAAAFFGVGAAGHFWWFLYYIFFNDTSSWAYAVIVMLDCILMMITIAGTLLSMLQDRRRPVWPIAVATIPIALIGGGEFFLPGIDSLTPALIYTLIIYLAFTIYMLVAVRKYGRWLRDNYADLEHKEVWQSHALLILFLLLVIIYGSMSDGPSLLLLRIGDFVLFGLLLWRVETLPQLEAPATDEEDSLAVPQSLQVVAPAVLALQNTGADQQGGETDAAEASVVAADATETYVAEASVVATDATETYVAEASVVATDATETDVAEASVVATDATETDATEASVVAADATETDVTEAQEEESPEQKAQDVMTSIRILLKERCEDAELYLMNGLTLVQLSASIGINRTYLSQYFSAQGTNYNSYINGLRINHFIRRYREAVVSQQNLTAQQLAQECGYRSYSTFSLAFKQRMGLSVSAWMHATSQELGG